MEPIDDPKLTKLLREWEVENAPRSLDKRILRTPDPWWRALTRGSVRVPVPVILGVAVVFLVLVAALVRPHPVPVPVPAVASAVNLADFRPVQSVQVRITKGTDASR